MAAAWPAHWSILRAAPTPRPDRRRVSKFSMAASWSRAISTWVRPTEPSAPQGFYRAGDTVPVDQRNDSLHHRFRHPQSTTNPGWDDRMEHHHSHTFTARASQPNYVHFIRQQNNGVCFSAIGMVGGEQLVRVDDGCGANGLTHEMEQHRALPRADPDRPQFLSRCEFRQYGQTLFHRLQQSTRSARSPAATISAPSWNTIRSSWRAQRNNWCTGPFLRVFRSRGPHRFIRQVISTRCRGFMDRRRRPPPLQRPARFAGDRGRRGGDDAHGLCLGRWVASQPQYPRQAGRRSACALLFRALERQSAPGA